LVRHKQWKRDIRVGTWNDGSPYRADSLTAAGRELARYKLDLVGVQEVGWDKREHAKSRELYFILWKRKRKSTIGIRIFGTAHYSVSSKDTRVQCGLRDQLDVT